jgi:hypothetical protein
MVEYSEVQVNHRSTPFEDLDPPIRLFEGIFLESLREVAQKLQI